MAALLSSSLSLPPNKVNLAISTGPNTLSTRIFQHFTRKIEIHGNNLLMMNAKISSSTDILSKDSSPADSAEPYNGTISAWTSLCKKRNIKFYGKVNMHLALSYGGNLDADYGVVGMHHAGILCENLERSIDFYQNLLGLMINEARPHDKLPYRGAWFWVGTDQMIHLMELPNPDPLSGRPDHSGRDRHTCIAIRDVSKLKTIFDRAGIPYTLSRSGRPAIFTRDPDANGLEFTQV